MTFDSNDIARRSIDSIGSNGIRGDSNTPIGQLTYIRQLYRPTSCYSYDVSISNPLCKYPSAMVPELRHPSPDPGITTFPYTHMDGYKAILGTILLGTPQCRRLSHVALVLLFLTHTCVIYTGFHPPTPTDPTSFTSTGSESVE